MITSTKFYVKKTFLEKIKSIDYILVAVILLIGIISCFAMYSTDGGQFKYYTNSHILKFSLFFILFIVYLGITSTSNELVTSSDILTSTL